MDLQDKVVVVTGAAGGIGLGVARHAARLGAHVVGVDLDPAVADRLADSGCAALALDVTDAEAVDGAVRRVLADHGRIDALVNCAGVVRRHDFVDIPLDEFDLIWRVNVVGVLLPSQAVARAMIGGGIRGAIVNLASVAAEHVGPTSAAYAASKGAVVSLTRAAAVSLAPHGIRVNAIMPGPVETPMNAALRDDPEFRRRIRERIPLGREGHVDDVAHAAAYLCGDGAAWVTGEVLRVDGGASVLR